MSALFCFCSSLRYLESEDNVRVLHVYGKKTPGGAGTHTGHTSAHADTDHTDEPHNHPNPTTHPHDHATAETAADSTAARTAAGARSRPLPAADSEEAAPSEPDPASTRSQSAYSTVVSKQTFVFHSSMGRGAPL